MPTLKSLTMRSTVAIAGTCILALLALGSASAPTTSYTTDWTQVPIPHGTLVNTDLRIESTGSSWDAHWQANGGKDFTTPFSVYWWSGRAPSGLSTNTLLDKYQDAYAKGARPVLIHVEGQDRPVHGLIVFNSAIGAAFGPGRQSYYLKIPEDKLRQAINGNITVAYERMSWKSSWIRSDTGYGSVDKKWFSWILWMSRTPLVRDTRSIGMVAEGN
jgi:hypothetical protein